MSKGSAFYLSVWVAFLFLVGSPVTSSRALFRSTRPRRMDTSQIASVIIEGVVPTLSGCTAFGITLGLSTCAQKRIGISTGKKLMARLVGVPTVCLASLISQRFTHLAQEWTRNPDILNNPEAVSQILRRQLARREYYEISERIRLPKDDVHVCLMGMATFKLLGGRFWAIAPSSYTAPGSYAYAKDSLPATEKFATTSQSAKLGKMFKRRGCHTCGTRTSETVVGDHMPPRSIGVLLKNPNYRFYAQCKRCSSHQGGILATASKQSQGWETKKQAKFLHGSGGGLAAYNHGAQFRINHLTGGIYGAMTMAAEVGSSTSRFDIFHKKVKSVKKSVSNLLERN